VGRDLSCGDGEPDATTWPRTVAAERGLRREDFCDEWVARVTARAARLGNYKMLTAEEREASRQAFLAEIGAADAWVFAYGSLMWNPAMHVAESRPGLLHGYHRQFCLDMLMGRGSPECPGLMLALDRGGSCRGILHRLAAADLDSELRILWMREMLGGAYRPRWVEVRIAGGSLRAIAFVANRSHPRYAGKLPEPVLAARIASAAGELGTNRNYLFRLVDHLDSLGLRDGPMHRLAERVRAAGAG